jgi:hypothetical protein
VLLRGLGAHQAARFAGAGAGFGVSAIIGVVSSTIALMKIIGSQNNKGMTRTPYLAVPCRSAKHPDNVLISQSVPVADLHQRAQIFMLLMEPERTRPLAVS